MELPVKIIDCRNMACPLPVITVKRALEEAGGEAVQVFIDPGAPRENVARFAQNRGYGVTEAEFDGGYALTITGGASPAVTEERQSGGGKRVLLVTSDRLGDGPEELGRLLMKNFIITLLELDEAPDRIFFLNTGVFLTTEGSELLEALDKLGDRGVEIYSCGLCLDFFNRKEKLRTGAVTNMLAIAENMLQAGSVIRL
jgi:selenium metabolism protein YedF